MDIPLLLMLLGGLTALGAAVFVTACPHLDDPLHFEGKRVFRKCMDCGRETPGWDISRKST